MDNKLRGMFAVIVASVLAQPAGAQWHNSSTGTAFGGGMPFGNGNTANFGGGAGYTNPYPYSYSYAHPYGYAPGTPYGAYPYGYNGLVAPYNAAMGLPVPLAGGLYRFGGLTVPYWRAPSGYYYPMGIGATTFGYGSPTYIVPQGQSQPTSQNPPLYSMMSDMQKYLDQSKKEGRVNDANYQHLFRRLQDLRGKYDHLMAVNGSLDSADEDELHKEVGRLGTEISSSIKPLAPDSMKRSAGACQPNSPKTDNKSGWVD
jgi:hypothetical protein